LLPEVALNFGNSYNINNTRQEFFSGDTREGNGVNTSNINANIQLAWTVFDGLRMFVNRDRLKEIENLGELNIRLQMENTVSQVMSVYYNIEQHQRRIETIQKAIEISKERYELASLKKNVGSGSGIPVLQAKVDINADSSALIRQQLILKTTKIQLNEILGRSPEIIFDISILTDNQKDVDFQELSEMTAQRNLMLQMADKNIRLSELNVKLWEGNKYPTIDVNLGYNFSRLKAEIGILKFNQNAGLSYGLTGRWNIFNGWNNKREIQVAKLGIETGKLTKEQTALSLKTDLFTLYNNYLTARELTKIEEENIRIAEQNLDITTEKMRLGTIDALELRQAQLNLVDVEFRKITSVFEARMAHLELMRLSGQLLK
ncbi:MAG TPA: TolC family protein, partial [Saprospiraceae bacterium]|nr:TolC family protein [Saprospiraceae bacterium]